MFLRSGANDVYWTIPSTSHRRKWIAVAARVVRCECKNDFADRSLRPTAGSERNKFNVFDITWSRNGLREHLGVRRAGTTLMGLKTQRGHLTRDVNTILPPRYT